MKKLYLFISCFVLLCLLNGAITAQTKTILIVGEGLNPNENKIDEEMMSRFPDWGFGVQYMEDGAFQGSSVDILSDIYGVVLSETVASGNVVAFHTWNYPVPCFCMEMYAPRSGRWGWLTNNDEMFTRHDDATDPATRDDEVMVIKNGDHYITQNYNVGDTVRFANDPVPGPHTVVKEDQVPYEVLAGLKSYPEEEWCFLFTVEAPESSEKIVMWGYNAAGLADDNETEMYATDAFWDIMKRSAQWVFDEEEATNTDNISTNAFNLKVNPNPATGISWVRFHTNTPSSAVVSVVNITGQLIDVLYDGEVQSTKNIPFNVSEYAPGVYFINLQINNGFQVSKFIVQ